MEDHSNILSIIGVNIWRSTHMDFILFFLIGLSNSKSSPYVEIEAMRPPLKGNL